jgi:hypothetical protein
VTRGEVATCLILTHFVLENIYSLSLSSFTEKFGCKVVRSAAS